MLTDDVKRLKKIVAKRDLEIEAIATAFRPLDEGELCNRRSKVAMASSLFLAKCLIPVGEVQIAGHQGLALLIAHGIQLVEALVLG